MRRSKIIMFIFLATYLVGCDGMNSKRVQSHSLGNYKYTEVNKQALYELLKLYEDSDKTKDNYEVYYKRNQGWNWHPKSGYLFFGQDLCSWGTTYSGVTLIKLKEEVERRINYQNIEAIHLEYNKNFQLVTDYKEIATAQKSYLCTNICNSGRDKF
jgi:hypothetical protein